VLKWFLVLFIIAFLILIVISPFYIYERYNAEFPIAELRFSPIGYQKHKAFLSTGDLCMTEEFIVFGDQFQLDASFIKWTSWAVLLGFESKYKLNRFSGRYQNNIEQNTKNNLSYDLSPEVWFDIFSSENVKGQAGFLVDSQYGSSVYAEIHPELTYRVYRTEDALTIKSYKELRATPINGITLIEINKACGNKSSIFDRIAKLVNKFAVKLLW
jgi:hypothetical protein